MRLSQYIEDKTKRKRASLGDPKAPKASIAAHRAFVPIMVLWGAALLGLSILVMPSFLVGRIAPLFGLSEDGDAARLIFAGVAAILGALLGFVISGSIRSLVQKRDTGRPIASALGTRKISPINPAADLGSDSLDSPIEADWSEDWEESWGAREPRNNTKSEPTLGELSQRGYEMEAPDESLEKSPSNDGISFTHKQFQGALIDSCEGASCEAADGEQTLGEAAFETSEVNAPLKAKPRQSKQQPKIGSGGRNGSWSLTQFAPDEESGSQDEQEPLDLSKFEQAAETNGALAKGKRNPMLEAAQQAVQAKARKTAEPKASHSADKKPAPVPASALAKLREKHTDELSLAEMIERFAGALHEHQAKEQARMGVGEVARDVALAEALKALTLFTEKGFDGDRAQATDARLGETERELRQALAKLQGLRGAA